jgi:protein disulfide-isomerase A1
LLGAVLLCASVKASFEPSEVEDESEAPEAADPNTMEEGQQPDEVPDVPCDESDVVILSDANMTAFVEREKTLLLEFYAPWCGHCRMLKPIWAEVATAMKGRLTFAKVDAVANTAAGEKYKVEGFPTIVFVSDGKNETYEGDRSKESLLAYANKKLGVAFQNIETTEQYDEHAQSKAFVVGFFSQESGAAYEAFRGASLAEVGRAYFLVKDPAIAAHAGAAMDSIMVAREGSTSTYSGDYNLEAVKEWISTNSFPLFIKFTEDTLDDLFGNPLHKVFLMHPSDEHRAMYNKMLSSAQQLRGKVIFSIADENTEQEFFQFMGLSKDTPTVTVRGLDADGQRFEFSEELSEAALLKFATDLKDNKAKKLLRSETVPEGDSAVEGSIHTVVGTNYQDFVNQDKHVIVEFFAPWCEHCKKLDPRLKKAAKYMTERSSDIVVGKIDGTQNDVDGLEVTSYPTLFLYPKGDKSNKIDLSESTKTVKELVAAVKKHLNIDFSKVQGEEEYQEAVKNLKSILRQHPAHIATAAQYIQQAVDAIEQKVGGSQKTEL